MVVLWVGERKRERERERRTGREGRKRGVQASLEQEMTVCTENVVLPVERYRAGEKVLFRLIHMKKASRSLVETTSVRSLIRRQ